MPSTGAGHRQRHRRLHHSPGRRPQAPAHSDPARALQRPPGRTQRHPGVAGRHPRRPPGRTGNQLRPGRRPPGVSGADLKQQWLPAELAAHGDRIQFTGWLTPDEVAAWYRRADVLVVPSRYEPFGMAILEGMLHGLPIVAADVGGPAEILQHQHTGLLFPPMDVGSLSRQLIRLVTSAVLRHQIGLRAANQARARWLWPQIVEQMRQVYEEIAPSSPVSTTVLQAS